MGKVAPSVRIQVGAAGRARKVRGAAREGVVRAATRTVPRVRLNMTALTGQMYRNTTFNKTISIQTPQIKTQVYTKTKGKYGQSYSRFQEDGTRAHGPATKPMMVWVNRNGRVIRAKWVRGTPARHMFKVALSVLNTRDFLPGG